MNDLLSKWREDFRKGAREQYNNGNPYWPDWDAVEKHIETLLSRVIGEMTPEMSKNDSVHAFGYNVLATFQRDRAERLRKTLGIQEDQ